MNIGRKKKCKKAIKVAREQLKTQLILFLQKCKNNVR